MAFLVVMATVHEKESTAFSLNIGSQFLSNFILSIHIGIVPKAKMFLIHVKIAIASRLALDISKIYRLYFYQTGLSSL